MTKYFFHFEIILIFNFFKNEKKIIQAQKNKKMEKENLRNLAEEQKKILMTEFEKKISEQKNLKTEQLENRFLQISAKKNSIDAAHEQLDVSWKNAKKLERRIVGNIIAMFPDKKDQQLVYAISKGNLEKAKIILAERRKKIS